MEYLFYIVAVALLPVGIKFVDKAYTKFKATSMSQDLKKLLED